MNDSDLALIARLSFVRSDLERFVFSVLSSVDRSFNRVVWPESEGELGRQLVVLGRTLELHAETRAVSLMTNGQPEPESDDLAKDSERCPNAATIDVSFRKEGTK